MKLFDQENKLISMVSFNQNYDIDTLSSLDTLVINYYDSINNHVLEIKQFPFSFGENLVPSFYLQKELCYRYRSIFLDSVIEKTFQKGTLINNFHHGLNEQYHKAKFVDPETGKKIKPLKRKLPVNYDSEKLYYTKKYYLNTRDSIWSTTGITPGEKFNLPEFVENSMEPEKVSMPFQKHMQVSFNKGGMIEFIWFDEKEKYRIEYTYF